MNKCISMTLGLFFSLSVSAQDPTVTDADKYKIIFSNERLRVLEYSDKPGDKTTKHQHPDSLVYALTSFKRKLILDGDKTVTVEKKEGEVYWVAAQSHIGENIGKTDTHVLIVELKEASSKKQVDHN